MKKVLSIVAFLALSISMMAGIHSYAPSSVLASGKWVKIRVSETGVCQMSFSEIQSAGLDPQQLRVFGYGGAQKLQDFSKPNIDDLPQVPVYVGDGYVLFWTAPKGKDWRDQATKYVVYRFAQGEKQDLNDPTKICAITEQTFFKLPYENGKEKTMPMITLRVSTLASTFCAAP